MKRFLLIDDHVIVRSAMNVLLSQMYNSCHTDEAHDADSAISFLKQNQYDLVILDVQIPETDTLGLMEYLKTKYPGIIVLIFSMSPENLYAQRFLKAGAMGFLNKNAPLEEIRKAVDLLLNNKKYISNTINDILQNESTTDTNKNVFNSLSVREFEIASLLLSGQTISKIAATLHLSVSTIGTHKGRIFKKLNVENLLEMKELAVLYHL
ncbi:MAG: response regulator transcription factor [Bacteroidetes bacterium]|nr:response regulator transcription factor [Bacteroidota bacterium]